MAIQIRAALPTDAEAMRRVMGAAFGRDPSPDGLERFRRIWEPERSFCAFDDGEMVGTSGAFSLDLTVPGGNVAAGGTTMVAVLPTHRRQGLLNRMIGAHLDDVANRGEPVAALWASESSIYGRFGYGAAADQVEMAIPRTRTSFHRLAPTPARVRLIGPDEARKVLPDIHDLARKVWPGFYSRTEGWWESRWFADPPEDRGGASATRYAVTSEGDGYVIYRQKARWEDGNAIGELIVLHLVGLNPESWAGLWSFVLNQDLIATVKADLRSTADPVLDMLADPRRVKQHRSESIWVGLVDPVAALAARRYQTTGALVIEAHDPRRQRPIRVHLEGGPEGALCRVTDQEPDLVLDLEDLGACYLGWARFRGMARAGRLAADHHTLTLADSMFGWDPPPWCPEIF
ncbi:MAG: GNAT family N-acetyltransferase [Actinomycetota bacterium]